MCTLEFFYNTLLGISSILQKKAETTKTYFAELGPGHLTVTVRDLLT